MRSGSVRKLAGIAVLFLQVAILVSFWAWNHVRHLMGNQLAGDATAQFLAYGRLAGLLAGFGALFQILVISRAKWLENEFGFDRLARLHHVVGFCIVSALLAHPVLVLLGHAGQAGISAWAQYGDFFRNWEGVGAAAVAMGLMIVALAFSAAVLLTRLRYEVWYVTHLLFYVAVVLAAEHIFEVGTDFTTGSAWLRWYWVGLMVFVFLNLAWYRLGWPVVLYLRHRFAVVEVRRETADATSVVIDGRRMSLFKAKAGQFVIVRFLAPGFRWEAHPFSLSNTPDGGRLRLTIKAVGDFTRRIPAIVPGTAVFIDGPHGQLTPDCCTKGKVLLMAGGIGITPLRSLAGALLAEGREVVLLYANRRPDGVALREELDALAAECGRFRVVHVISDDPAWTGEKGRLDRERIARLAPDVRERVVYLCGPPPMMKGVRSALRELGVPSDSIHWERFTL